MRGLELSWRSLRMYGTLLAADRKYASSFPLPKRLRFIARGFLPVDCQSYDLERWPLDHYVSALAREVKLSRIQHRYNVCLHDKYLFQLLMQSLTTRIARAFGVVRHGSVVDFGDARTSADAGSWLRGLIEEHGSVVIKPLRGHGGVGFRILASPSDVASVPLRDSELLVTHYVDQHPYASAIYPGSTNTLRLLMMRDEAGVFLAAAGHRFGTARSAPVDSVKQGGISSGVDPASGTLKRGLAHPRHTGGTVAWVEHHPDTGARIEGVAVPGWDELVAEMLAITERLSFISYVGWDVVKTASGFTIIEGNHNPDVSGMQVHGPLLVDERVKDFFRRHGVRTPQTARDARRLAGADRAGGADWSGGADQPADHAKPRRA